jgi:UDP-2,3-diacylglucosamine pyrophosphatase LpxH
MPTGIFTNTNLPPTDVEFCVASDFHIGADESNFRNTLNSTRQDYVFANNKIQSALSAEAHTLKRFCQKILYSGKLGMFEDGRHKLVLLGDIINGECGYFASYKSIAYRMLLGSVLPWIYTGNIIYVCGNHDKEAKFYTNLTGFPRGSIFEDSYTDMGVKFSHGHKFDPLCDGKTAIGLMGDLASEFVTNLCSPALEDLFRGREFYEVHDRSNLKRIGSESISRSRLSQSDRMLMKAALNDARNSDGCHTAICGHTHQKPMWYNSGQMNYINTGKFARDGFLNVVVRRDSELEICRLVSVG